MRRSEMIIFPMKKKDGLMRGYSWISFSNQTPNSKTENIHERKNIRASRKKNYEGGAAYRCPFDNDNDNDVSLFRNTSYLYNTLIRLNINVLKN